jgi:pimeloyl-ACP methyl ester carboxylesterase
METVTSEDGTLIAFQRTGAGPALVLVHGTSADHTRWAPVLPALNQHFTVYAVDRRGRGGSGDAAGYSVAREFEDIAALCNAIGGPVNLLGHSYGGLCSLGAATHVHHLRRLILYEPPIPAGIDNVYPPDALRTMQDMLAAGDRDGVVSTFMSEIVRMPPHELELLRSAPAWQGRLAAAHTILREIDTTNSGAYRFDPNNYRSFYTPTLLLLGGDSPAFLRAAIGALDTGLPNSRVVVMPGQQHTAMNTAPDLFVSDVVQFLTEMESEA